jgi:hypothetical protein
MDRRTFCTDGEGASLAKNIPFVSAKDQMTIRLFRQGHGSLMVCCNCTEILRTRAHGSRCDPDGPDRNN